MNLYLLLLVTLTAAINTAPSFPSPCADPNTTQPLPSLGIKYRCAPRSERDPSRHVPTALDCLNVLTFVLITTPNHDEPTQWSANSHLGHIMLPYIRNSGTCQLLVRLTEVAPALTTETAAFDQVIAAALRIIEVCLLNSRPDVAHCGGAALAGQRNYLDVIMWGTPKYGGNEAELTNQTISLNGSGAWVSDISQT